MTDDLSSDLQKKLAAIKRDAEDREAQKRATETGHPYIDVRKAPISIEAVKTISEDEARAARAVVIQSRVHDVALAVANPEDPATKNVVKELEARGYKTKIFIASPSGIEDAWHWYKLIPVETKSITGKVEISKERLDKLSAKLTTIQAVHDELAGMDLARASTTEFFEVILAGLLPNRASDLHLEAQEKSAKIRYRIDGVLHDVFTDIPPKNYRSLTSRIKLLSGLKINVTGEAQDGRFTIRLGAKDIEMRVSIIPSEYGETIVMRVLDPDSINIDLPGLGLREDDLALVEKNLAKPNGLILNTGPTGSGKTTTLYAFLRHVNKSDVKIITVEDPIEYHLKGVSQTQTNAEVGYTFASGLRSILRQDPDVILVGEIRDQETADIAMQASLTGHLVFSTLHTNSAVGAVPRLIDLGVKPATIGPALTLVIAQRLVRRLCKECKKPKEISAELKEKITKYIAKLPARVKREPYQTITLYEPVGCAVCNNFGYKGRAALYEFLEFGPELEELILKEASEGAMKRLAEQEQMVTMQQDGVLKVVTGLTTLEEVEEVAGAIEW